MPTWLPVLKTPRHTVSSVTAHLYRVYEYSETDRRWVYFHFIMTNQVYKSVSNSNQRLIHQTVSVNEEKQSISAFSDVFCLFDFRVSLDTVAVWQWMRREYEVLQSSSLHYLLSLLLITASSPGSARITCTLTAGPLYWIILWCCQVLCYYSSLSVCIKDK